MNFINYEALKNVMRTQKPFRGTTNRFPLTQRKLSYKYFLHETDASGNNEIMRIIFGKRYRRDHVTEAEYLADKANINKYGEGDDAQYIKYTDVPNELGIVRPDNSFEFTAPCYYQGDKGLLSNFTFGGYFKSDCRRGGMILVRNNSPYMFPIYENMRVDCTTMKPDPSHKYCLLGKRVDRKKSKQFMQQYDEFFKVSKAMMKNLDMKTFRDIAKENVDRVSSGGHWLTVVEKSKMIDEAKKLMNDSPLDSASLYCVALGRHGVTDFWWRLNQNYDAYIGDVSSLYEPMKQKIYSMLYQENPDLFHREEYEFGKVYPPSAWGYELLVDGVAVKQYE